MVQLLGDIDVTLTNFLGDIDIIQEVVNYTGFNVQ